MSGHVAASADPLRPATGGVTRAGTSRVDLVDVLRGLVIALMVLDHVRDYFHVDALAFDPTNLARTTPVLFFTRWVTHLCAPAFVFLSGASVWLQRAGGKPLPALSRFLLTRGLWLIALEVTVISFGFNFAWPFLFVQVIWAIGFGLVLLSLLVRVPRGGVLGLGAVIVAGHQLLGPVNAPDLGALAPLWTLLMEPGPPGFAPGIAVYPAVPWFGVMCLGYGLGPVFLLPTAARDRTLLALGSLALTLFIVLRGFNGYGNPRPWATQGDALRTVLSFINVGKYPPSLLYVLVTLGVSLMLAPLLGRVRGPVGALLLALGRTPLFTYLLHVYLVHGLALLVGVAHGVPASAFTNFLGDPSRLIAAGWGLSLPWVYAVWLAVVLALFPAARWYAGVKRRSRSPWLSYL